MPFQIVKRERERERKRERERERERAATSYERRTSLSGPNFLKPREGCECSTDVSSSHQESLWGSLTTRKIVTRIMASFIHVVSYRRYMAVSLARS